MPLTLIVGGCSEQCHRLPSGSSWEEPRVAMGVIEGSLSSHLAGVTGVATGVAE